MDCFPVQGIYVKINKIIQYSIQSKESELMKKMKTSLGNFQRHLFTTNGGSVRSGPESRDSPIPIGNCGSVSSDMGCLGDYPDTKNTVSLEQRYMIIYDWVHDLSHSSKYSVGIFLRCNVITLL
jgi:hypothetical protein